MQYFPTNYGKRKNVKKEGANMIEKQFLGGLTDLSLSILTVTTASYNSAALESRCAAIKDEDRLGTQKEELAYSTEESQYVSIPHHFPFFISHRLHELYHPYARICQNNYEKVLQVRNDYVVNSML